MGRVTGTIPTSFFFIEYNSIAWGIARRAKLYFMMGKEVYEQPMIEVVELELQNVIAASGFENPGDGGNI